MNFMLVEPVHSRENSSQVLMIGGYQYITIVLESFIGRKLAAVSEFSVHISGKLPAIFN